MSEDLSEKEIPEMWNPQAAINWSILLTPVFGAWIQAQNWQQLGNEREKKKSYLWMVFSIICVLIIPFISIPKPFSNIGSLVFLLIWYLLNGKEQLEFFKNNNLKYEKKSWLKPVSIGLAGVVIIFVITVQLLSSSPLILKQVVEEQSPALVDQIVQGQLKLSKRCKEVLVDEVLDGQYLGKAVMDDNSEYKISVKLVGDTIVVRILEH